MATACRGCALIAMRSSMQMNGTTTPRAHSRVALESGPFGGTHPASPGGEDTPGCGELVDGESANGDRGADDR